MRHFLYIALIVFVLCSLAFSYEQTVPLLRKYCKACHAIGKRKFIKSEIDEEVWDYIFSAQAPSKQTWAEAMVEVLNWPTHEPPDPSVPMAPGRDWMPKGVKRFEIVEEFIEDRDVRQFIYESIKDELDLID